MAISSDIFESYLQCATKGWLRANNEVGGDNLYPSWQKQRFEAYRSEGISRWTGKLQQSEIVVNPVSVNKKTALWKCAVDCNAACSDKSSRIQIVERIEANDPEKRVQFVPVRFIPNNKITKIDRLMVAYDAVALSESLRTDVGFGMLIHGDTYSTLKVKTPVLVLEVKKVVGKLSTLLSENAPPDLVLNRHCPECEYQIRCREKAVEKDDLSLLGGMSEKERKKLNSKGIFTVTQLSYTFRPRRRPKRLRDKKEKYHHSLKALAIREKKIHIVGTPELKIEGTPVYLDVEGVPDRDFYYLIGLRYQQGESIVQHSLWADGLADEGRIWKEFLALLSTIEQPILVHYGSYETSFFKAMRSRYGEPGPDSLGDKTISSAINLLSAIYGSVYFPVYSNGLKDVAGYLGVQWSDEWASGLQSIVWRETCEASGNTSDKAKLISYNAEDCEALEVLMKKVFSLQSLQTGIEGASEKGVIDISKQKREHPYGFKRNSFIIPEFETINQAAYWDYQRERVYLKTNPGLKRGTKKTKSRTKALVPNEIIEFQRPTVCPECGSKRIHLNAKGNKTIIDLKFTRNGIKRWVINYLYRQLLCFDCKKTFLNYPHYIYNNHYGNELMAYSLYQCIELRIPIVTIDNSMNKLFALGLPERTTNRFKTYAANKYQDTYNTILTKLCSGNLLHSDETKISLKTTTGYVWVFTSMEEVAYFYTETREGDYIQSLLKDFKGVLVSDFYAAYDAINCPQQKCLVHMIRDINDALYKHPYDEGLKLVAEAFKNVLQPMIETVNRFGLKHFFLKKHLPSVDRFYRELSRLILTTDTAIKLKERLEKNRGSLFTFLSYDGIPWNNNNAEHAVKPFTMLRRIINGTTTEKGLREYLILLSICETCKYRDLDFLDFLRSGEIDIDVFAASKRRRRGQATKEQTSEVSENLGGLVLAT